MEKGIFVTTTILVIVWILFVTGVTMFLFGISKTYAYGEFIMPGIILICTLPFGYGFCYIVKAACRYLELHQNDSRSNEPKRKVYSDKLTDLYR